MSFKDFELPLIRLKYAVRLRNSRAVSNETSYIGLEHIESGSGKLAKTENIINDNKESKTNSSDSLCSSFQPGDVLFGKLRPYLAKTWIAEFPGHCTTELLIMQPSKLNAHFLKYICLSQDFINKVTASSFGSKMPRSDWNFIGNMSVPCPSKSVQCAITEFLDREVAQVDALIVAKERVLELLAEKRRALIAQAVTIGLDNKVALRKSGIPWLQKIPSHWENIKAAWLFRDRDERCEPDLPLLEVSINDGVKIREFSDDRIESTASDFNTYKVARKGDIVFNKMRMWQGAVGVAPEDGLVSPDYTVAKPTGSIMPDYAGMLFRTDMFSAECARNSHGIVWDRLRLYWEGFREIMMPVPPLSEQRAIVAHVKQETAKIDKLRAAVERTIELLKERRSALISAAVTGQIDVQDIRLHS